jgi:hypothetical protein
MSKRTRRVFDAAMLNSASADSAEPVDYGVVARLQDVLFTEVACPFGAFDTARNAFSSTHDGQSAFDHAAARAAISLEELVEEGRIGYFEIAIEAAPATW